jgi:hypothetical protein
MQPRIDLTNGNIYSLSIYGLIWCGDVYDDVDWLAIAAASGAAKTIAEAGGFFASSTGINSIEPTNHFTINL